MMAIIAVLVALVASATFQVIGVQQERTTETTIRKVADALDQQWQAVLDQAKSEPIPPNVTNLAGGDARRARVIYIKLRLAGEFPVTFSEALNPKGGASFAPPPTARRSTRSLVNMRPQRRRGLRPAPGVIRLIRRPRRPPRAAPASFSVLSVQH